MKTIICHLSQGARASVQALLVVSGISGSTETEWLLVSPHPLGMQMGKMPTHPDELIIEPNPFPYRFARLETIMPGTGDDGNAIYGYKIQFTNGVPQF